MAGVDEMHPSVSMNVDLPAPGAPLMPTRRRRAGRGQELVEQRDRIVAVIGRASTPPA